MSILVNWCRLSVESRALTCPFKQNNPSIWSLRLKQKQVDRRLRIVAVPGAQEEVRRKGVETEIKFDKSSSCDVAVTCDVLRFFFKMFWN